MLGLFEIVFPAGFEFGGSAYPDSVTDPDDDDGGVLISFDSPSSFREFLIHIDGETLEVSELVTCYEAGDVPDYGEVETLIKGLRTESLLTFLEDEVGRYTPWDFAEVAADLD